MTLNSWLFYSVHIIANNVLTLNMGVLDTKFNPPQGGFFIPPSSNTGVKYFILNSLTP